MMQSSFRFWMKKFSSFDSGFLDPELPWLRPLGHGIQASNYQQYAVVTRTSEQNM